MQPIERLADSPLGDAVDVVPPEYHLPIAAVGVVVLLALWRYRVDRRWFGRDTATFWRILRRTAIPLLGRVARRLDPAVDADVYVKTQVRASEHAATLDVGLEALLDDLHEAGYEPQPLASLATDWEGRVEIASWARYYGEPLFDGAPDWLADRQVHVRLFRGPNDEVVVTAHDELNPWRHPVGHYRGQTLDRAAGVAQAAADLNIERDHHDPIPA